jgi:tRNA (cytosine49-C5)-methyltransferase
MKNKLPEVLMERLKLIYSKDELKIIEKGFKVEKRKPTFRVNTLKSNNEEVEKIMGDNNIKFEKIEVLENWYVLMDNKISDLKGFWLTEEWKIYFQWVTSQLAPLLFDFKEWDKVLDMTAAPWAKTSLMSALLNNTWEIVANELNTIRMDKLKFTVGKQGCKNVKLIKEDVTGPLFEEARYTWYFDKILFDAPCSSEWRINLNKEKIWDKWSTWNIKRNYKVQMLALRSNLKYLKTGWELIYSTCTLAPEENEAIVHFLLCNYPELEVVDILENDFFTNKNSWLVIKAWITEFQKSIYKKEVSKTIRILPSESSEWFFVAKFVKKAK